MSCSTGRSLRQVVTRLAPPIVLEGLARVARPKRHFRGPISVWPAGASYGAGDADLAAASVRAVSPAGLGDLLELAPPTERAVTSMLWSLAHDQQQPSSRVVDFGGGGGPLYHLCRELVPPSIALDWWVYDLPHVVAASTATTELSWTSELDDVPRPIHTVVTDACLQYIEEPFGALRTIAVLAAKYLIINRLPLTDGEPFLVMQRITRARRRIEFPMHVLNRTEFDAVVTELGLHVLASWVCGPAYRIRYGVRAVDTYGFVLGS
jgi:putative methyltransferase (TIGR04325 family)